jgi:Flp pilus assembly protein TadB
MKIQYIAMLGGLLVTAGVVLGVFALIGTTRAPGPPSEFDRRMRRFWAGEGIGRAERQTRRVLFVAGLAGFALGWLFTGMPVAGLIIGIAIPGTPWLFAVGRAERRQIERIEAVGEWSRRLKDISGTGVGLQQAIISSTHTAPNLIADEVASLAARLQAGWNPRLALMMFADDISDPVCDQVVAALVLHLSDRGEHLGEVLASIATAAASEVSTRREVEAKRTQPRFAVKFLTGMTLATLAFALSRPEYMKPYRSPTGQVIMLVLVGLFLLLLLWVRSMSQPPRVPRFLASVKQEEVNA